MIPSDGSLQASVAKKTLPPPPHNTSKCLFNLEKRYNTVFHSLCKRSMKHKDPPYEERDSFRSLSHSLGQNACLSCGKRKPRYNTTPYLLIYSIKQTLPALEENVPIWKLDLPFWMKYRIRTLLTACWDIMPEYRFDIGGHSRLGQKNWLFHGQSPGKTTG